MFKFLPTLLLLAVGIFAQDTVPVIAPKAAPAPMHPYVGVGWFIPLGAGSDYVESGPSLRAGLEMELSPEFGILLEGAYSKFAADLKQIREDYDFPAGMRMSSYAHILEANFVPKLYLTKTSDMAVFATFGGGVHFMYSKVKLVYEGETEEETSSDSYLGIQCGGGFEKRVGGKYALGFLPAYHVIFIDGDETKYFTGTVYLKF